MSGIRTNAAAELLGVSPNTLRSWERRFGYPKPCSGNCPVPHISLHVSRDGGGTWQRPEQL